jgi:hypothetical protein
MGRSVLRPYTRALCHKQRGGVAQALPTKLL